MTTSNANGIIFLEETDPISPFHTLMNVLQQGTSDAIDALRDDLEAGINEWAPITLVPPFNTNSSLRIRQAIDGDVTVNGMLRQNAGNFGTGKTSNVFTVGVGFRPVNTIRVPVVSWIAGSSVEYSTATQAVLEILPSGAVNTYTTGNTTGLVLDNARWSTK